MESSNLHQEESKILGDSYDEAEESKISESNKDYE